jgi:hypothetical protein
LDFFGRHPNPENRIQNIDAEIGKLGSVSGNTVNDGKEFHDIQQYVKSLSPALQAGS